VSATAEVHVHTDTQYGSRCRQAVIGVWWQPVPPECIYKCVCVLGGSGFRVAAECLTREDVSLV